MSSNYAVPVISVVGWANSGKTTFLEKLVTELKQRGCRVGIIKHHRGTFEIDKPGKDTWRMARAGAVCTAIAGPGKVGLVLETEADMRPEEIAALMPGMDIIITEGYKQERLPQIEVCRAGCKEERSAARDGQLVAVVGEKLYRSVGIPCFNIDDASGVADFIAANYLRK
ncbi:MAG: hypothetical protein JL56_12570 [Desulfotomaculum sp. BICA1-6]|nr:MAG: hypothetical protein VR67_17895 [Peptococcaceae bacterium BRH_c8a]KJS72786.1 MAG: hypothetical protein JL56_12570 [Desulfotomaculum sp. BICA1-6]